MNEAAAVAGACSARWADMGTGSGDYCNRTRGRRSGFEHPPGGCAHRHQRQADSGEEFHEGVTGLCAAMCRWAAGWFVFDMAAPF